VTVFGNSSGLTLQSNWFQDNSAGSGGGMNLDTGAAPLVDANTFVTNTAAMGGGIYTYLAGAAEVTNNILARNTASGGGGGVAVVESPLQLINNTIADNTLDGVWFAEAEGVTIVNNIISGNSDNGIQHYIFGVSPTMSYTVAYNDVYGNANPYRDLTPGAGNMSVDPQFVGAGPNLTAYYHIQDTSPVSVTGSTSWAPQRDIDGRTIAISGRKRFNGR
jgi:parallel beta-helix repeat protein